MLRIIKCTKCGHHNIDRTDCYNCGTILPASNQFLGTFRTPDGKTHIINENTPVDILLDVIESMQKYLPFGTGRKGADA